MNTPLLRGESSTSSSQTKWSYDVFLSFRGEDTRNNFSGHLYTRLCHVGVKTFIDDEKLRKGDVISTKLEKAIEEQTGEFGKTFAMLKERSFTAERVEKWRAALTEAANLSGWDSQNVAGGHESKCIESIIKQVLQEVNQTPLDVARYPIGLDSRIEDIEFLLQRSVMLFFIVFFLLYLIWLHWGQGSRENSLSALPGVFGIKFRVWMGLGPWKMSSLTLEFKIREWNAQKGFTAKAGIAIAGCLIRLALKNFLCKGDRSMLVGFGEFFYVKVNKQYEGYQSKVDDQSLHDVKIWVTTFRFPALILSVLGLVRLNIILQGQRNTLYSSTEAPSLATTLEQNMKELDSDLLVTEVFVPIPTSSEEFILGPCFKGGSPSELVLFYPLEKGEKLLLHSLDSEWNKGRTWKSWPNPSRAWIDWVD
ncbi:putative TMV resistance protein N-like [Capsicum annuum]|nr:putative TMV resistance protein N-like [Capsicum annuum]